MTVEARRAYHAEYRRRNRARLLEKDRKYYEAHKEQRLRYLRKYSAEHPDYKKDGSKKFRERHPERMHSAVNKWAKLHPEMRRAAAKRLRESNPERAREKDKAKRRQQLESVVLRSVVGRMLRGKIKDHSARFYTGCSAGFLRNHLEEQFKPGMTWENWGSVWHIDHRVPLAWWDLKNHPEHAPFASHYSNLQPLFKAENMSKGARSAA